MSFQIHALDPKPFQSLFGLPEAELRERNVVRMTAAEHPGFPCRVGLCDMPVGASALLLNFRHQDAASPYRANGPIFVEEGRNAPAVIPPGIVPDVLVRRLLSLRAYDVAGMIVDADVVEGRDADAHIRRMLSDPAVSEIHAHFARRGCYAARITRG
jgi:hypothetical protein